MATARGKHHSSEQYVGWETYLKNHRAMGGEVFKTRDSLEWFCRRHTEVLVTSGQLVPRRGPAGTLYGPNFTQVALTIFRDLQLNTRQQMTVTESQDSPC